MNKLLSISFLLLLSCSSTVNSYNAYSDKTPGKGKGSREAAERVFDQIISLQPDSPQAHWSLSTARKARDHHHIRQIEPLILRKGQSHRSMAFYSTTVSGIAGFKKLGFHAGIFHHKGGVHLRSVLPTDYPLK